MLIRYEITTEAPGCLKIRFSFAQKARKHLRVALPSFRPGRYQAGNFTANIFDLQIRDQDGRNLVPNWKSHEQFEVEANSIQVTYCLLARNLSAGNTYYFTDLLIINPVNACLYLPDFQNVPLEISVKAPFSLFCALPNVGENVFLAQDFDLLADSPIIGGAVFNSQSINVKGYPIHFVTFGQNPELPSGFLPALKAICTHQIELFGKLPVPEYWFYLVAPEFYAHHGVEHLSNTVCLLGPRIQLADEKYRELLSLLSHEFLHVWNVKLLRPKALNPYPLNSLPAFKESYLVEGLTTYLGDKLLFESGVISRETWLSILERWINTYLAKPSRFLQPLGYSAVQVWSNGYSRNYLDFTQSIYNEGAIFSFLLDAALMRNNSSLEKLLAALCESNGETGKGYTEADFIALACKMTGESLNWLFEGFVDEGNDMFEQIDVALNEFGYTYHQRNDLPPYANLLGIKAISTLGIISGVYPSTPFNTFFIQPGDRIVSINGQAWTPLFAWELVRGDFADVAFEREGQIFMLQMKVRTDTPFQIELSVAKNAI
jgi:predicted metalloprotease with PDZ domain